MMKPDLPTLHRWLDDARRAVERLEEQGTSKSDLGWRVCYGAFCDLEKEVEQAEAERGAPALIYKRRRYLAVLSPAGAH